jgi:hypothetical protein
MFFFTSELPEFPELNEFLSLNSDNSDVEKKLRRRRVAMFYNNLLFALRQLRKNPCSGRHLHCLICLVGDLVIWGPRTNNPIPK